jgi:hypothetical protein
MSSEVQRKNHRIHPCNAQRKNELLDFLIAQHPEKKILIATANSESLSGLSLTKNITIVADADMKASEKNQYDILISYDLPEKAIIYMTRFAHAREMALILLGLEDQKNLYGIETLLGRTIIQEIIKGFEPAFGIAVDNEQKAQAKAQRQEKQEKLIAQDAARGLRPRRDPTIRDTDYMKKPSTREDGFGAKKQQGSKPHFVGKDENGKPIFEGKTRERNHYIDGTPRSDAEKAIKTPYSSKPKFFNDTKKTDEKKAPYGEKKPFDKDKKPFGDKKPFDKDKKPFGDKKPYNGQKSFDKPAQKTDSTPARPPRRIDVKSLKPKENKE